MSSKDRDHKSEKGDGGRHAGGASLEGLRRDAASELGQQEAEQRADISAEAARQATAARVAFEEQQKERARQEAVDAASRESADAAAREAYQAVLDREAEARKQAAADASAAGREWKPDEGTEGATAPDSERRS
jgi:hypothetical protein